MPVLDPGKRGELEAAVFVFYPGAPFGIIHKILNSLVGLDILTVIGKHTEPFTRLQQLLYG
ncbi:hypothetical protein D3C81_2201010 [compost metagenome]